MLKLSVVLLIIFCAAVYHCQSPALIRLVYLYYQDLTKFLPVVRDAGNAALQENQWEKAKSLFEQAIKVDEQHSPLRLALGQLCQRLGYNLDSKSHFVRAIRLEPGLIEAYRGLALLLLDMGSLQEALRVADRGLKQEQQQPGLLDVRGRVLLQLHRFDEAEESFRRAVDADPNFHFAWNNLGTLQMQRSDFARAIESFQRALSIRDEVATYANIAICKWRILDWSDRGAVLQRIASIIRDATLSPTRYCILGLCDTDAGGTGVAFHRRIC